MRVGTHPYAPTFEVEEIDGQIRRRKQIPLSTLAEKKHTELAMAAMTKVELGWKRRYMLRRKGPGETQRGVATKKFKQNKYLYVG